jgi:hypothetical protein
MTPEEFATCWVPVPTPWRYVVAGDTIAGRGERPWTVVSLPPGLQIQCGADWWPRTAEDRRHLPDPDDEVQVLTPVPMAQAMALTRAELGARVIERRNTTEGAA